MYIYKKFFVYILVRNMNKEGAGARAWRTLNNIWNVLAELVNDMRRKGIDIPEDAMTSLRCCKSLIVHLKSHLGNPVECESPECRQILSKVLSDMTNLESYLILICVNKIGEKYAEEWSKKLMSARLG